MKFIDFFAGVGGFRRGMELAGHECVGFCEWDKFAVASYTSMHLITDEQRNYLETLPMKKRQMMTGSRWRNGFRKAKGYPGSFKNMEKHELLKYALEHGMINVSYSEVFDEWNDRRLPICGDFLRLWEDFLWEKDIHDILQPTM